MNGAKLFVLLSSLWSGGIGLDHTEHPWTTPEDENSHKKMTSLWDPVNKTQSLQMLSTTQSPSAKISPAPVLGTSEVHPLQSTLPPSESSWTSQNARNQTATATGKTEGEVESPKLAFPNRANASFKPEAETVELSNSTLKFLQSFARKSDQQANSPKSAGDLGNRSPRETYPSRGDSVQSQRTTTRKSSFETTRGKNWCAYVHTRLSPSVILDNQVSYAPSGRGPCAWTSGSCLQRAQKISSPVYRMQHKIVTSLEWKCCPGYSGPKCQLKAQEQQQLMHSNQAESHTAIDRGTAEQMQLQQQQDCDNPAVMQKLTDQISQQAVKLTTLQKKMDNISLAVDDLRTTQSSLERKISDDKSREFQSFLKGLKSKSINDLVKDTVRQQFKIFQNDMQETVAQLFKTISRLSEDLENTRQVIWQVNQSVASIAVQQKSVLIQKDRPTLTDIVDLKNRIVNIRQEMTDTCEKPIKELELKQAHLEGALEQEHTRSTLYYESLNKTLAKMKEVHTQLLSTEQESDKRNATAIETVSNNTTEDMSVLYEKVSKQGLMLLQIFADFHIQDSKITNLTISLEREKEFIRSECEDMLAKCRNDFKFQLKDTEENLLVLNQTLAEILFPMDNKMDKMGEQLNDLTYDMEILQPLLEQGASLQQTFAQPKEASITKKKVESLISAVNSLNFLIKELTKRHNLLRNEVQKQGDTFEQHINAYGLEMEDALNKTVTIMNNAIDFVQDNYVLKETLHTTKHYSEVHHKCNQNMETILTLIPQVQRLNDSIHILLSDNERYNFVLKVAKALVGIPKDEKLHQSYFQKIYQIFNETTSQLIKYQENMSHLEENVMLATKTLKNFETRLQVLEFKVTQTLIPSYISLKTSMTTKWRDQDLQLQVLNSRFKALEAKSIHLSINFSLINKTLHEFLMMCPSDSTSSSELNVTTPKWIKGSLPDSQQKCLTEFVGSIIEMKTQAALSNFTQYVERLRSGSLANVVESQKQVKKLKKLNTLKKPTVNLTTILINRTQRNTDNIVFPVTEEESACSSFPCQNGGTCINGRSSFTCACRHPFSGKNCTIKLVEETALAPDFSKGSYRYAPMVAFFASHTYGMTTPGPILFNNLEVNYGASYNPRTGKFQIPYLGVYVFKYTIESFSAHISGFLVVDRIDKLAFESENINSEVHCDRVLTGDALLELNYGQEVWLRLVKGTIPAKFPPVTTFSGYLLYRT
uniref:Multimerin-1 n=1 Tax=Cavia porcellus TaxID=10141 RepID=H0V5S7_CAVPO|nr:multimerin-1 isoform X1 [Cavia porcellus]XP_013005556.1 multimerin-1 isoform X1 [Cavia porcellus]XP_013005557.1 multimerin-1 isoform X1 [Cavia porcellus]